MTTANRKADSGPRNPSVPLALGVIFLAIGACLVTVFLAAQGVAVSPDFLKLGPEDILELQIAPLAELHAPATARTMRDPVYSRDPAVLERARSELQNRTRTAATRSGRLLETGAVRLSLRTTRGDFSFLLWLGDHQRVVDYRMFREPGVLGREFNLTVRGDQGGSRDLYELVMEVVGKEGGEWVRPSRLPKGHPRIKPIQWPAAEEAGIVPDSPGSPSDP